MVRTLCHRNFHESSSYTLSKSLSSQPMSSMRLEAVVKVTNVTGSGNLFSLIYRERSKNKGQSHT